MAGVDLADVDMEEYNQRVKDVWQWYYIRPENTMP